MCRGLYSITRRGGVGRGRGSLSTDGDRIYTEEEGQTRTVACHRHAKKSKNNSCGFPILGLTVPVSSRGRFLKRSVPKIKIGWRSIYVSKRKCGEVDTKVSHGAKKEWSPIALSIPNFTACSWEDLMSLIDALFQDPPRGDVYIALRDRKSVV